MEAKQPADSAMRGDQILSVLQRELTRDRLRDPRYQALLQQLSIEDRETIALTTGTMVQYYGDEVAAIQRAEEQAALKAAPPGFTLEELNGVNVGCGSRTVHSSLLNIDAHKGEWSLGPRHHYTSLANLRAWAHELPFERNSIDFIVALHMLEHLPDPVAAVLHWLDVVKPGGGVGIVVPDWRYTWDARTDTNAWGHRWNPTPELIRELYDAHWKEAAELEALQSYPFKLSFDLTLRKRGEFRPFDCDAAAQIPSGWQLHQSGRFIRGAAA